MIFRAAFHVDQTDPGRVRRDIEEELSLHLEQLEQDMLAEGHTPAEAARAARRRFGDPARIAGECEAIVLKEFRMARKAHLVVTILLALSLAGAIAVAWNMTVRARQAMEMARAEAVQARVAQDKAEQALEQLAVQAAAAHAARAEAEALRQSLPDATSR